MLILRLYSQDKMNWLMAGFVVIWMIVLLAMYGKMHSGDDSFEAMVENMKQYDTLIDWKQIDVDQIAQQVKPLIQEAQQKDDPALFYTALCFRS